MLTTVITVIHVLVAIGIVGLVLIQHGKGADAGAAFGAGAAGAASGSVFGAKGSGNFLSRSTAVLATMFFLTSLSLAYMARSSHEKPTSMMDSVSTEVAPSASEGEESGDMPTVNKDNGAGTDKPASPQPAKTGDTASDMPRTAAPAAADNGDKQGKIENSPGDMPTTNMPAPTPAAPK